jgi:predicted secreted protein
MRALPAVPLLAAVLLFASTRAPAQMHHEIPADVVRLQAEASREIDNDQMLVVLAAEAEGQNPAELAASVNRKMADALKAANQAKGVKARSGNYQTSRLYGMKGGREGRPDGWQVSQELRMEATDFTAAAELVGKLQQSLVVRSMAMRLSPQARRAAEDQLVAEAIAAFQARAEVVRQAMKASAYRVRELSVGTSAIPGPRPMAMRAERAGAPAAPVAVEAGQSHIVVTAAGAIQLERK